mgnify:FL=1
MLNLHNIALNHGENTLLEGVNIQLDAGSFCTIIGENGCGKSTLLRCIAGLHAPLTGAIMLNAR